jgi:hypothetical protein
MENVSIFYDHLVYFTAIGNVLWPFGIFCDDLVYFSPFWYVVLRKIWQPWLNSFALIPPQNVPPHEELVVSEQPT